MERVSNILDSVMSTKDLKKMLKWKEIKKIKWVCEICGHIITETLIEKQEMPIEDAEWMLKFSPDAFKTKTYVLNYDTICSKDCHNNMLGKQTEKEYDEKLKSIPLKFKDIEADEKLVKENFSYNLFITGKSGSGKSVLAAGIIKECIRNNKKFKWISYPSFIMELQDMFKSNEKSPYNIAKQVAQFPGVLVIDDLGANKTTEWVRQMTYFIINEREERVLPIIITSNFSLQEIADQIDRRISSRIAGMCKLLKLNGNDRRIQNNNKKWVDNPLPSDKRKGKFRMV